MRVSYYIGDPKSDPNSGNYVHTNVLALVRSLYALTPKPKTCKS